MSFFPFRIIRELFLNCNGVNQMTELNYLDCVRSYSLKAFETLIFCLEDQHMDQVMPDLDGLDNEQKKSALELGVLVHRQQATSDVPQSLSKFYSCLKEDYPKKKKSACPDVHINVINIFLCVAFLCVSKEADADRDSANDSEDTSGYDSTASEPLSHRLPRLSPESLTLPSSEHIHRAADIWSVCCRIYLCSSVFQRQFHRLGGFEVCHRLITMIIQKLAKKGAKEQSEQDNFSSGNDRCLTEDSYAESSVRSLSFQMILSNEISQSDHDNLDENPENGRLSQWVSCGQSNAEQKPIDGIAESRKALTQESEWSFHGIRLLEALLTLCLHSANNFQQKTEMEFLLQVIHH